MTDGMFVTVEGIDGSGKSTLVQALGEELEDTRLTHEPTGLWTGQQVRKAIANESDVGPITTLYLFMADRMYHINQIVRPSVEQGKLVISDRYADSSRVYQPLLLEGHVEDPDRLVQEVMRPMDCEPDLTLLIDIDPETAIKRTEGDERYEKLDFLEKVAENYDILADIYHDRVVKIDGEQSKEAMVADALEVVREYR